MLRKSIATKQSADKAVQGFVDQLQAKDNLLLKREKRLHELTVQTQMQQKERNKLVKLIEREVANVTESERAAQGNFSSIKEVFGEEVEFAN